MMPKPRITYYRGSFATNSSSSHSVLLFEEDIKSIIEDRTEYLSSENTMNFNWEDFILVSKEKKINYLNAQIIQAWSNLYETELKSAFFREQEYAGIDHQSVWEIIPIPNNKGTDIDETWYKMMVDWICNEKIVIYGGNDNENSSFEPPALTTYTEAQPPSCFHEKTIGKMFNHDYRSKIKNNRIVGKYVKDGNYYILFNRLNGAKSRISFNKENLQEEGLKNSPFPELIDLKITDYCPFNCSYCYQDSTLKGKHASLESIKKTIDVLAEANVFEVAIGGGEPTLHPDFAEILKYTEEKEISANFTTKNYCLIKNKDMVKLIEKYCGAFAFSVDCLKDVEEIAALIKEHPPGDVFLSKIVLQHPVGTCSKQELRLLIEKAQEITTIMTFLGHKETGRGNLSLLKATNRDLLEIVALKRVKNTLNLLINVDTSFAKDMEKEIKNVIGESAFKKTMSTKDGVTSGYIDAVTETFTASSYEPERESFSMLPLYGNIKEFKTTWEKIQKS